MQSSYITYFEGYNKEGQVTYNGNGSIGVEHNGAVDANQLLWSHVDAMLKDAQVKNASVVRIVIKSITKL